MLLWFIKMHGCGNDYIFFDCFGQDVASPAELSKRLSDRHFGIGGDGIVLICTSEKADAYMRMFNADGSEGKMCGNAIRCVGKYLYESGRVAGDTASVETLSGVKTLSLDITDGKVDSVSVDMGRAVLTPAEIPVDLREEKIIDHPYTIGGIEYNITCVGMGNPHCVVFMEDIDGLEIEKIGPLFENDKVFSQRVNTEFIKILNNKTLKMRVWERGSGETLACGTGACAAVVAACENGYCTKGEVIKVILTGGELNICYTDERVIMNGPAVKVFEGEVEI